MARKSKGQRALDLVEKWLGVKPVHDGRKYRVEYQGEILSWHYDADRDVVELIHSRRANDMPDFRSDYFPGTYYESIEAAIKSLAATSRRETGDEIRAALGWYGAVSVKLGFKPGAGFVRQAEIMVTRWVYDATHSHANRFCHEVFVLHDAEAIAFAGAFIDGEMPAGALLDWLMDRDEAGMPQVAPFGRQPKNPPPVVGRLRRFLEMPPGILRGEVRPVS